LALKKSTNQAKLDKRPLSIWFMHDLKPGHIHQLQGLEERIASYCEINASWIDTNANKFTWIDILLKNKTSINALELPSPDIVIGAGHMTHKALLFGAHTHKAYSAALMKPSLPLYFFDAIICPEHDNLIESKRILNTYGALNTVKPTKSTDSKTSSLMLIGGPSKHFEWQEQDLINQIQIICGKDNDKQWLLSDSPRTPSSFLPQLKKMNIHNLSCFHYQNRKLESLNILMQKCAITWVTPDSVSMVYESLTANTPTFLFNMSQNSKKKPSRVARSIEILIKNKHAIFFKDWQLNTSIKPNKLDLWEADRAAKWLLNQYFEKHPCKNIL